MKADITVFVGHLHPLVVHLPIGCLLLSGIFYFASRIRRYGYLYNAVRPILFAGFVTATAACLSGYVLSLTGDYESQVLGSHRLAGIVVAIVSGILLVSTDEKLKAYNSRWILPSSFALLLLLLTYTGHLGATLTHGDEYLTWDLLVKPPVEKPARMDEALIFDHVIQPMLEKKCAGCHGSGKRKGKLSLVTLESILKGGKSGPAVVAGKLPESEMYKRITLDPSNEKFMPADGKPPLTKSETMMLTWWIEKGLSQSGKKFSELQQADEIKPMVASYLGFGKSPDDNEAELEESNINPDIPMEVNMEMVDRLRSLGLGVRLMYHHPVMLDITLFPGNDLAKAWPDLEGLAKNIVWLNLSDHRLNETDLEGLSSMTNLEKLRLEKNPLGDGICEILAGHNRLESVNLNETRVGTGCIDKLKKLPAMKTVYSWKP